jgi:hypothetical protein
MMFEELVKAELSERERRLASFCRERTVLRRPPAPLQVVHASSKRRDQPQAPNDSEHVARHAA